MNRQLFLQTVFVRTKIKQGKSIKMGLQVIANLKDIMCTRQCYIHWSEWIYGNLS